MSAQVVTPGSLGTPPKLPAHSAHTSALLYGAVGPGGHALRIFAGQPDPADASRFTIHFEMDGKAGVLVGRLTDDDTVLIEPLGHMPGG